MTSHTGLTRHVIPEPVYLIYAHTKKLASQSNVRLLVGRSNYATGAGRKRQAFSRFQVKEGTTMMMSDVSIVSNAVAFGGMIN